MIWFLLLIQLATVAALGLFVRRYFRYTREMTDFLNNLRARINAVIKYQKYDKATIDQISNIHNELTDNIAEGFKEIWASHNELVEHHNKLVDKHDNLVADLKKWFESYENDDNQGEEWKKGDR